MSTPALVDRVRRRLIDAGTSEPSAARVARALREEGVVLGEDAVLDLVGSLRDELAGAGPLEPLLREPSVTDVLVNSPGEVWVDFGEGLQLSGVVFPDGASVRRLAQRLAAAAGRRLDESAPFVDAQLPDGTRLHAVIPPIARECAVVSLRIPRRRSFTLDQLVEVGSLTTVGAAWLRAIVDARLAFLISGGTGTGKTTILSTLLGCVDARERLVIVEDSAELRPEHPHRVCLQSRPANVEGAGAVTLTDLVRQALRMRPDRVIVGEVRGAEVVDLLAALNTGHEGGCGTVHANSASHVPARLEALGLAAGLPRSAVHSLTGAGIDAVIHLTRDRTGSRRVAGVHVMCVDAAGIVEAVPAISFDLEGTARTGPGWDALVTRIHAAGIDPPRVDRPA